MKYRVVKKTMQLVDALEARGYVVRRVEFDRFGGDDVSAFEVEKKEMGK